MELWTDYEGLTVDGAFPLKRLLMPEGRSAFFSTSGPNGEPTVVRLIECHFDEEEILSRWRCIDALNHPNFLKFVRFGLTDFDGRPILYAVFENVDGNLAEVLDQGSLSVTDVAQLATSLVSALDVLHTHGYVHEHIVPRNIFAIGTTVKLRADCIREAPEGEEGRLAKQRDVRDLATVLLQALTQRDSLDQVPDSAIPPPYRQIIRNALNDTWGLADIKTALPPPFEPTRPASPNASTTPTTTTAPAATPRPSQRPSNGVAKPATTKPSWQTQTKRPPNTEADPSAQSKTQLPLPLHKEPAVNFVPRNQTRTENHTASPRSIAIGVAALFAILILWAIAHTWSAHHQNPQRASSTQSAPPSTTPAAQQLARDPASAALPAATASRSNWRVIAFTYNRQTDAAKKVSDLEHSHPELHPSVFTPTGRRPFLVSIGGTMSRDAAYSLARHSRSLGLPHDTYAQNYTH
ncbi:MAG: hypothetical protein WBY53_03125 [Acidobacteriaceae bacterium]